MLRKRFAIHGVRFKRIIEKWRAVRTWLPAPTIFGSIVMVRLGSAYGGGYAAISLLNASSVVYSVGVGEEISFDEELYRMVACRIIGIDPTPRSAAFVAQHSRLPAGYQFVPTGLAPSTGQQRFYFPANPDHVSMSLVHNSNAGFLDCNFLSLTDLMANLNHTYVDMVKIDIEGAEYDLLTDWLAMGWSGLPVGQLWIEFHPERAGKTMKETQDMVLSLKQLGLAPLYDGKNGYLFVNLQCCPISWFARIQICLQHDLTPL